MFNYIFGQLVRSNVAEQENEAIYRYGFEILTIKILYWISFLVIAAILGFLLETVMFLLLYSWIRIYAGGYHATSIIKCYATSLLTVIANCFICGLHMSYEVTIIENIIFTISVLYIILNSPVDNKNKVLEDVEKEKYKKYAITITVLYATFFLILTCYTDTIGNINIVVMNVVNAEALMMIFGKINNKNR